MRLQIGFDAPETIREVVDLLNRTGKWELTLVDSAGKVYGHYQSELLRSRIPTAAGTVVVYSGEVEDPSSRPLLVTDTDEAAVLFLYGCFLGAFGGKSVESIQDDLSRPRQRNERLV